MILKGLVDMSQMKMKSLHLMIMTIMWVLKSISLLVR